MKSLNPSLKRGFIMLTAAIMLSGCEQVAIAETSTIESTSQETTAAVADIKETEPSANESLLSQTDNGLFLLEEGKSYLQDLDGDGTPETIRYQTTEKEYYSYAELYVNDQLLYNDEDAHGFLLNLYLTDLNKDDEYQELCVYATSDSETTQILSFLRYENSTLKTLDNLSGKEVFDGTGLYYRGGIHEVRDDGTIVINMDTPVYANMFGCYYVPVCFRLEGNTINQISQDYYTFPTVKTDEWPGYVVNSNFTAVTEPGGSEAAFTATPGEIIDFNGFCILNGQFYGQVTNAAGVSGWLIDIDMIYPGEEGAYFEQVMLWG